MKNNQETKRSNPLGVPCQYENSEEIREEHRHWKSEIRKKKESKTYSTTYWKNKSSCVAL